MRKWNSHDEWNSNSSWDKSSSKVKRQSSWESSWKDSSHSWKNQSSSSDNKSASWKSNSSWDEKMQQMCGFDDTYRGSSSIGHNAKRHKPNAKAAPDKLPKGWMRIRSEKSRAIYYYSMFTGQSTFTQPSKNDNHTKKPQNRKKVRGPRTPNEDGTEPPLTPLGPGAPTTPLAPGTPLGAAPITPTLHEVPGTPHGAAAPITPTLHDVKPHDDMDAAAQPKTIEEWKSAQGRCFGHLKPLPTNWIRMYSRTTGKMYFYNVDTGQSKVEEPSCSQTAPSISISQPSASLTSLVPVTPSRSSPSEGWKPLPANWSRVRSKTSGKEYFYNNITGESQVEEPTSTLL